MEENAKLKKENRNLKELTVSIQDEYEWRVVFREEIPRPYSSIINELEQENKKLKEENENLKERLAIAKWEPYKK